LFNDQSAETNFNLASAYNDLSDFKNALIYYNKASELDKNNIDANL